MSAAASSAVDEVLFEARASALGGDVDEAGRSLVVLADRVELRDGSGRVEGTVALVDVADVAVKRRLSAATVTMTGTDGVMLRLKGVKPSTAAGLRDTVAGLRLPSSDAVDAPSATPTAEALRRIDELAAMGLLSEKEVAAKRAMLAQRGAGDR